MSYLFDCYAGVYDHFMKMFHLQDTKDLLQLLPASSKRILDVGGGTGVCANQLYQLGHDVVILDASATSPYVSFPSSDAKRTFLLPGLEMSFSF